MTTFACPFGCGAHKFPRDCRAVDSGMTPAEYDTMMQTLQRAKRDAEEAANVKFNPHRLRSVMEKPRDPGDMTMEELTRSMKAAAQKSKDDKLAMLMYGTPGAGKSMAAVAPPGGPAIVMPSMTVMKAQAVDQYGNTLDLRWHEASSSWQEVEVVECGGCEAIVPIDAVTGGTYRGKPVCVDCDELFSEVGTSMPRMFSAGMPCGSCGRITPHALLGAQVIVDKKGRVVQTMSVCPDCRLP